MATWGEILMEIGGEQLRNNPRAFDDVRRKYLKALSELTKRNTIAYATGWTSGGADPSDVIISPDDILGLMEVCAGLEGRSLDLILHSPGGTAEAAEALVSYLRSQFDDIRVIIPHAAMSAATMLACSANRIVMGKHSFIGPIDPQFILQLEIGRQSVAAHAILEQFKMAQDQCTQNPALLASWLPMLKQYGPALIVQCQLATKLSCELVTSWLKQFMFSGQPNADVIAGNLAHALADHSQFKSHGRFIDRTKARGFGLVIDDLEADKKLQTAVLSVYHAIAHALSGTPAVKIIENHLGKAYIRQKQVILVQQPAHGGVPPRPTP